MTTNAAESAAPILIGLDIGTTNIKATAFTPDGALLASSSVPTTTHYPSPECAYYLAAEIWSSATSVLRSVVAQIDFPDRIAGIAATSMGEAGVLIDQHGNALCHKWIR